MRRSAQIIDVYENFKKGMLNYFSSASLSDNEKKKKSTTSHRIALTLAKAFPSTYTIDIDYMGADIIIRNGDRMVMAILWSNDYLTEKDKDKALKIHADKNPTLTIAFSILEDKNYILIYRFEKDFLEYLHISKEDFSEELLKRCELDSEKKVKDGQLMLGLRASKAPKKRAPKKKEEKPNNE